ncbi:MAG TPA: HDOD domain-containing protein [Pseudomonadales bacterium]|nr:HDOD domain-containing protein [Pseudomonadales bacterium]
MSARAPSEPADLVTTQRRLAAALAARAVELPPMPGVAAEVIASSIDDQADAIRLAQLIQTDQGLASHVLRIVNSPALRAAMEIVALRQAIARLGMNRIREIAIAASLSNALFASATYADEANRAWQLALGASLWSKEIARVCRKNTEIAYLCGLLHNVGAPVVLNAIGAASPVRLSPRDVAGLLAEFEVRAGALLAEEWRLPSAVAATIRYVDDFRGASEHVDVVAVVRCAVRFARSMLDGELNANALSGFDAIDHLNLYPEDVAALIGAGESIRTAMQAMSA